MHNPYPSLTLTNASTPLITPTNNFQNLTKRPKLRAEETVINPSTPSRNETALQRQSRSKSTGNTEWSDASSVALTSTPRTDVTISDIEPEILSDNESAKTTTELDLSDSESEERMLDPKAYFSKLKGLVEEVFENSALKYLRTINSNLPIISHPMEPTSIEILNEDLFSLRITGSQPFTDIDEEAVLQLCHRLRWRELFHLFECRNMITRVCVNLKRLQAAGFCGDFFSLLVQDQNRDRVTRLIPLSLSAIYELEQLFESSLSRIVYDLSANPAARGTDSATLAAHHTTSEDDNLCLYRQTESLSNECLAILALLDLEGIPVGQFPLIWRQTVHILDLAVLSYAGAHIERIDENYLNITMDSIPVFGPFAKDLCLSKPQIYMKRRRLECLDKFLGAKEVWVFHSGSRNICKEHLYLSTDAQTLGDIWGPLWKSTQTPEPNYIYEYQIGNGCIVPWTPGRIIDSSPKTSPRQSEVLCHWVSFRERGVKDIDCGQHNLTKKFFTSSDTLLIGVESCGLQVNEECIPSISYLERLKTELRERGSLKHPRTHRARRYKDSHSIQVQASALGLASVAGTVMYKRRGGHSMKDTLVERWRNGCRNPIELEAFSGVEVSLCTQNARRRRLLQLLSSQTMRKYLKGISFELDKEACQKEFFNALRSPKAFRKFWGENCAWRKNIGDAILYCLDAFAGDRRQ